MCTELKSDRLIIHSVSTLFTHRSQIAETLLTLIVNTMPVSSHLTQSSLLKALIFSITPLQQGAENLFSSAEFPLPLRADTAGPAIL